MVPQLFKLPPRPLFGFLALYVQGLGCAFPMVPVKVLPKNKLLATPPAVTSSTLKGAIGWMPASCHTGTAHEVPALAFGVVPFGPACITIGVQSFVTRPEPDELREDAVKFLHQRFPRWGFGTGYGPTFPGCPF